MARDFDLEVFSERLKDLRVKHKLTTIRLGEIIGVSNAIISQWETGKRTPTISKLFRLAQHFGVSAGYLIGLED